MELLTAAYAAGWLPLHGYAFSLLQSGWKRDELLESPFLCRRFVAKGAIDETDLLAAYEQLARLTA